MIALDPAHHDQTQIASWAVPAQIEFAVEQFDWSMRHLECELDREQLDQEKGFALVSECANALITAVREYSRGDDNADSFVRARTAEWFMRSNFHTRAHDKPRGYAGDYYTIELLYDAEPHGIGHVGLLLDRWALQLPAAQAVRNRRSILVHKLATAASDAGGVSPYRITSLGSGPAREIIDLLSLARTAHVRATCIDIDREALTYAAGLAARAGVAERIRLVRANVVKLALGRNREYTSRQHVIYSVGLFDYLTDEAAVAVLNWIYTHLTPGGTVIVGNVQPSNPTRTYMETLLNWRLIHRSADELYQLFSASRFGETAVQVECEPAGVQLFATATRRT